MSIQTPSTMAMAAPKRASTLTEKTDEDLSGSFTMTESEEFDLEEEEEIPRLLLVDMQQDNADDVVYGLKELADHLRPENKHCQSNIQEAVSCGAPSILVLVMRKWNDHEVIQTVGCCCTFYLASSDSSCRNAIAKAGGLETIVEAMNDFPTFLGIQFAGCGAIMKSISTVGSKGADSVAVRKATRKFVRDMDGVSVVLRAMMQFRRYGGFQAICCEALDKLASDEEFRNDMFKSNVVNTVAATLELHGEDETCSVKEHAARFMVKKTFWAS